MKRTLLLLTMACAWLMTVAQRPDYGKMSSLVRQLAIDEAVSQNRAKSLGTSRGRQLCAFVRISGDGDDVLRQYGCTPLMSEDDIWVASIPVGRLAALSRSAQVKRIEAGRGNHVEMDTVPLILNATKAYSADGLPQAYTGKGVVVGVMDIGIDLTNPNFYDTEASEYRIKSLWDQLAADSNRYVGRSYEGEEALLALAHTRDGLDQTHGTHTLGIAAGGGWDPDEKGKYRGMAYESDICLVANATSENAALIDSADYNKYTYATDAMGFKYIFDYAESRGLPCVVSFSEGSGQDFRGDDQLYYEMLGKMTGAGKIIVASAGNSGGVKTYFRKPSGTSTMGCFLAPSSNRVAFTLKADKPFTIILKTWGDGGVERRLPSDSILSAKDSTLNDSTALGKLTAVAYKSCYNGAETCFDVSVRLLPDLPLSLMLEGEDADVEYYWVLGAPTTNDLDSSLDAGEQTHSILSPSSAPSVISVGATGYRSDIYTYLGNHRVYGAGLNGRRWSASSVGPTFDGRVKPDVVAPGVNVISSYSSYYLENHPQAWDIVNSDKKHYEFNGRTYAWNYNSGTSMSAPVVAGAIALWLQAKPSLTPSEIMDLLSKTCSHPDEELSYPNNEYGYGQIDVYRGLLEILGLTGIEGVSAHQIEGVSIRPKRGVGVELTFVDTTDTDFSVSVYSSDGRLITTRRMSKGGSRYEVALPSDCKGVYLVQVDSRNRKTSGSALVRL